MAIVQYTARVKESRLLELPEEAQSLCLQPGEEIDVIMERNVNENGVAPVQHAQARAEFHTMLSFVSPSPQGDFSLLLRAEAIRGAYTCYRSADAVYIALAEDISTTRPTILLTLDDGIKNQAQAN